MGLHLSKPEYHLDIADLENNREFIVGQEYWRAIRRRVPFFMDGYRYAAAAVKQRWGVEFAFFEAGHEQVKPCYPPGLLNKQGAAVWWQKMNEDNTFAERLIKEILEIVAVEKQLAASVPQKDLTPEELKQLLYAHLKWWIQYFEIAFLWFGVEDIQEKVNEEIRNNWKGGSMELDIFLDKVYRAMKLPLSSVEQRDLLQIAKLEGDPLEYALKVHNAKYRHLALHNIDDEYFDIDYYRGRVQQLKNPEEYKKAKATLYAADEELVEATRVIESSDIPTAVKEHINFVRWFMYIRTETIDHYMLVNGAYKAVFAALSEKFSLSIDALLHMTYEELISSLEHDKLSIPRELVLERTNNGYAFLIATPPHKSYLVVGTEADALHRFVIPQADNKSTVKQLNGQSAFKGKVRGSARVLVDRRNARELRAGEILVTTMTSPEFVPAMKISGGIITNEGGILCHAAIMARELGKPCIIGTKVATDIIKTGQTVVLDADNGTVYLE